jgi:hypothetical protein
VEFSLSDPEEDFFAFPYPSDLRLKDGRPDLASFPRLDDSKPITDMSKSAQDRPGFPVLPVAYFQFDGPLPALVLDEAIAADMSSDVLLMDVDPASPERGKLFPMTGLTLVADAYVPENVLALTVYPGVLLKRRLQSSTPTYGPRSINSASPARRWRRPRSLPPVTWWMRRAACPKRWWRRTT